MLSGPQDTWDLDKNRTFLTWNRIAVNECMVFGGTKGDVAQGKNIPSWWDAEKRADVEDFKSQAHKLGLKLLEVFATHFSLPAEYFSAAHNDERGPGSVLRMLHYPKLEERPDKNFPRLYSHTDWGSVTFVWPQGGGLEVETPSKKWMPVPLVPGSIVVNIGDALSLWSDKTLKSTLHKISFDNLPIDQDRWSMAYFVNANQGKLTAFKLSPSPHPLSLFIFINLTEWLRCETGDPQARS